MKSLGSLLFLSFLVSACVSWTHPDPRTPANLDSAISGEIHIEGPVGIYSGTFNPIHLGHIEAAEKMADHIKANKIILIPNLDPKNKNPLALDLRWRLISLAIKDRPHFFLPSLETLLSFNRNGNPIEDARLWVESRLSAPSNEIYQFMGEDSFIKLTQNPAAQERLKGKARWKMIVLQRDKNSKLKSQLSNVQIVTPKFFPEVSSSRIRKDPLLAESTMPREVAELIKAEHLYGRNDQRGFYDLPASLTKMIDLEQWLNERIENTTVFTSIKENTLPESYLPEKRPIFPIYTVDVPMEKVVAFGEKWASTQIVFVKNRKKYVRFFVHPESKPFFEKVLAQYEWKSEYLATPLSSHRSLIVWNPNDDSPPLNVKVTLDAVIGGARRFLTKKQIHRAFAASSLIRTLDQKRLYDQGIFFLDEPSGFYLKNFEYGFSTRNIPELAEGVDLMPMFSLYSKPAFGPPPLVEMIRKSGQDAKQFLQTYIIDRMVMQSAALAFEYGLVAEPHEQNVLIEIKNGYPTGNFHYRDFGGFSVNEDYRRQAGRAESWLPKGIDPAALKAERADFLNATNTYLKDSNFFALQQSVSKYYPEISKAWVDEAYRRALGTQTQRYFGRFETNERAVRKLIIRRGKVLAPSCESLFQPGL